MLLRDTTQVQTASRHIRRHGRWGRWMMLAVATAPMPIAAQVTYNVFPALPVASTAAAEQPVNHGVKVQVTLDVQDSTVEFVVNQIVRSAHLRLLYNNHDPMLGKRISVHLVQRNVMDAMAITLRGTRLQATLGPDGETIILRSSSVDRAQAVAGTVGGLVTDSASGQALSGVSVKVAGTKLAAVSADNGRFTLKDVPAGTQVLNFRLFGYKPVDRTVTVVDSQETPVRVVLAQVPTVLSGVVTTATGQTERYKVGNDITVLNADSILKIAPVTTLTDMLETRVPGLIVEHTNGIPGAPSRLRLRGTSSIYMSSDPIVIVDGIRVYADQSGSTSPKDVPVGTASGGGSGVGNTTNFKQPAFVGPSALDQIDPNSIETIEVMKGPSATAIYGSDAANGVIIVTTKHGRAGPTHWTLALDQGRTTLPGSWPTNYYAFCTFFRQIPSRAPCQALDGEGMLNPNIDSTVTFQALNNPRYSPLIGKPGQQRNAALTVSGGIGGLTYSVTGSAADQTGYLHLPGSELQRFQASHGFAAPTWMRTPNNYSTYGGNSLLAVQLGKTGGTIGLSSALYRSAQQQSSLQGDLAALENMYIDTTTVAAAPIFTNYYTRAQLNTTTFTNAVTLNNWMPWPWLPLDATVGLNVHDNNNNALLPRDYAQATSDSIGNYQVAQGTNTVASLTAGTTLWRQRLMSTAVGINVYTTSQSSFSAEQSGLPIGVTVPASFTYAAGHGPSYGTASSSTYGWYVQPTLNIASRFFASPGFRLDGGSNSGVNGGVTGLGGSGNALSLFPKLDFSWLAVSRPPSDPLLGVLTLLRPRIAFGIAGIQPGPADRLRLLVPSTVVPTTSGGGSPPPLDILTLASLGNTRLHPERDRELEGGFDAQLWNQRLTLTVTGYQKMAYDAILSTPVAPSVATPLTRAFTITSNIGTIRNNGVEATASARILDRRLVDWSVNANIAKNTNDLVKLAAGQTGIQAAGISGGYSVRIVQGFPLFGFWAPPVLGYSDANHNGVIEGNEVRVADSSVYVGSPLPNYEATVSTSLGLLNDRLTISTSVDYQNGLTQVNLPTISNSVTSNIFLNPAATQAQQAALAGWFAGQGLGLNSTAIGVMQTVNVLRWNTLSVSYLVPPRFARLIRVPSLSVALQGSNLGLHTNYHGKDPAVNAYASGNLTADNGQLPQPRVWDLRVTLGN